MLKISTDRLELLALEEGYRRKGYMTEALSSIIEWIFLNQDVKCVVADTLKNNMPSHKVLDRIGMVVYKEDEECLWWKRGRKVL